MEIMRQMSRHKIDISTKQKIVNEIKIQLKDA